MDNPFRFSSEYFDVEINLVYYNYRYYNPSTAKWLNRDPVEEKGGVNLYGCVNNNVINKKDNLGLKVVVVPSDKTLTVLTFILHYFYGDGKTVDISKSQFFKNFKNEISGSIGRSKSGVLINAMKGVNCKNKSKKLRVLKKEHFR